MKSLSLVTAFLLVCIVALSQVYAVPVEPVETPMGETEGVVPPVRVEQPETVPEAGQPQTCAPTVDVEQAHRNLIMAVCEQMQPGFMHNMMQPGTVRTVMQPGQGLGRRDVNEANPAQFAPFPPFPPPPTFPPFPPFPPGGRSSAEQVQSAQFPPFPPFPPPPTFPPFPPFPPGRGGGGRGRGN